MNNQERIFVPYPHVIIPVLEDVEAHAATALARELEARTSLVGLVCVSEGDEISTRTTAARRLRKQMEGMRAQLGLPGSNRVRVTHSAWGDLIQDVSADAPDLLILEWPAHFACLDITPSEVLANAGCNIVIIRGDWPPDEKRILVPLRGGPNAEMALRLALAMEDKQITALHVINPDTSQASEAPFRGLARILPNFPEVHYMSVTSGEPVSTLMEHAGNAHLLVIGASARPAGENIGMGRMAEQLFEHAPCTVMVVNTKHPMPVQWSGPEGERAGGQAISLLVDKWFAENTYHADEFDDLGHLVDLKRRQGTTISLALPALNEEETVGEVITCIRDMLVKGYPLVDEIVLIDSNSTDQTREIAASLGVPVHIHQKLLPGYGPRPGKGEALWKSLYVTRGDILVWIDTDIVNIHPRFVYGVIGPLLVDPHLQFVKGFYQRPLRSGEGKQASGGGRVTELTARPLLNMFYPELSGVIQPLSGEYGGRRGALEQLPFFSGYGVETGLLVDVFERFGLGAIAQVDLLERVHHNQTLEALSKMSFVILQAFFRKLERRFNMPILEEVNKSMKLIRYEEGNYYLRVQEVVERERPPMVELPEYLEKRGRENQGIKLGS